MNTTPREIKWKAPEHHYFEKTIEWFLILFIIAGSITFSAFYLGNTLLGLLVIIATVMIVVIAVRKPRMVPYSISVRGIRVGGTFYATQSLTEYSIDEDHRNGPHLLAVTNRMLAPMLVIPIPQELVDDIELILSERVPEGDLHEPLYNVLLEIFRF